MSTPLTDEERHRIAARIRAGDGRNEIARAFNRSPSTVSKVARDAGLVDAFDRSATHAATVAKQADMAARRAELASKLLDDAERFRAMIYAPATYKGIAGNGSVREYELEHPTFGDIKAMMIATGIALDHHMKLTTYDRPSDESDATEVDRWLVAMMGGAALSSPGGR